MATVVLVPVLVALLVLTVAGSGRAGGGAAAPPPTVAPGVAGRAELGAGDQGARSNGRADDPRLDVEAPRSRPAELLSLLADARAAAWREATPALLGEADAPRSAAAAHDAAAVAQVAAAGVRYTGLRYSVAEVTTVAATPERAVLRARIDAGAYAVTTAAASTPRPAMKGAALLVDLVRTDVGWRVCDLRPVP